MRNLKNLKNLPNGDLCRIFAKETEELFQTERQSFLGVLQINLYKPNKMINIVSKEQPTPKIGTKEMEMKYSLHIQYAGTLSTKEVVAFAAKHTGMQSTAMKAALDSCCYSFRWATEWNWANWEHSLLLQMAQQCIAMLMQVCRN